MQGGVVAGAPRLDADTLNKALGELASRQRQGEKALWVLKHTAPSETDAESLVGFTPQTAHTPRSSTPALEHPGQAYGGHGAGWGLPHAGPSGDSAARAPAGPAGRPDAGPRHRGGADTAPRPVRDRRWLHNGAPGRPWERQEGLCMLSSPGRACASHCPAACLADPLPRVDGHQARGSATLRSHTRRRARRTGAGSGRSPAHSVDPTAPPPPTTTPGTPTPTATCGQTAAAAGRAAASRRAVTRRGRLAFGACASHASQQACSWPPCPRWWASP